MKKLEGKIASGLGWRRPSSFTPREPRHRDGKKLSDLEK
jgi:hypothetical protein